MAKLSRLHVLQMDRAGYRTLVLTDQGPRWLRIHRLPKPEPERPFIVCRLIRVVRAQEAA